MQKLIESIKNLTESDFYKRVNLHIHTSCSDGKLSPNEVISAAIEQNLEIISITDHNTIEAYNNLDFYDTNKLKLINGVEFDCWHKFDLLHILGYGINPDNEKIKQLCAKNLIQTRYDLIRFFNKRKAPDVIKAIKESGGIAILAHPACCWNINLKQMIINLKSFGLDGLEVYYPYIGHRGVIKFYSINNIRTFAEELELIITGGTDSHGSNLRTR